MASTNILRGCFISNDKDLNIGALSILIMIIWKMFYKNINIMYKG